MAYGILQQRLQQQRGNHAQFGVFVYFFFHAQAFTEAYFLNGHEFFQQIEFLGKGDDVFLAHTQG